MKSINFVRRFALKVAVPAVLIGLSSCHPKIDERSDTFVVQEVSTVPLSPGMNDWPHTQSDLKPDERVKFGRMANGLRYAILPVPDMKGAVSLQMNVAAGFNDEPKDAYGVAHIVEHMAFRGARGAQGGSIIHDLETMGAQHGKDVNGFTSPDHTLYIVNLPSNDRTVIDAALLNMSQLAIQPNFSEENLSLEKGVVLAEMKQRDSLAARAYLSAETFENPYNERNKVSGIGTQESINGISLAAVKLFHETYYRPDNTMLTIAGDVKVAQLERIISRHYSKWSAKNDDGSHVQKTPEFGLENLPERFAFEEKRSPTELQAMENLPPSKVNDTIAFRQTQFAERIATSILKKRLNRRVAEDTTVSWINPFYRRELGYDVRGVRTGARDYLNAMTYFEEERLRLLKYDLTQDDVKFALRQERSTLETHAERPDFIDAWREASHLRDSFNEGRVYLSSVQNLGLFAQFLEQLSLDDYNQAARTTWDGFKPRYWTQSNELFKVPLEEVVAVSEGISDQNIDRPAANKLAAFEPSSSLQKGQVQSRDRVSSGKVHRLLFENGSRLNYQQSDSEPGNIEISVAIDGDLSSFVERYGSVGFRASAFSRADIAGITKLDLDQALTAKKAHFSVYLVEGKIVITSSTRAKDLGVALSVIATFIADVDYDSEHQRDRFKRQRSRIRKGRNASPMTATRQDLHYEYSGKSSGFRPMHHSEPTKTLKDIEAIIENGSIEVGIAGDFDPEALEEAFSESIGGLPSRQEKPPSSLQTHEATKPLPPGVSSFRYFGTDQQMALSYCWPLASANDPELLLLQVINVRILYNRIVGRFRGEQAMTYSPQTFIQVNPVFPNFKFTCLAVQIDPQNEHNAREDFSDVLSELRTKPISRTELDRAREPAMTSINDAISSNRTLAFNLGSAYSAPEKLLENDKTQSLLKRLKLKTVRNSIATQFDSNEAHIFRTEYLRSSKGLAQKILELKTHIDDIDAQLALGKKLIFDRDEDIRKLGLEALEIASAQGSETAKFELGKYYIYRQKEPRKAAEYLEQVSETKEGAFLLGRLYFQEFSTFPDVSNERIIELFTVSAERGSGDGQFALAQRLKDGSMVKRDEIGALKWVLISNHTRRGKMSIDQEGVRRRFSEGLTESQVEMARADAKDWVSRNSP